MKERYVTTKALKKLTEAVTKERLLLSLNEEGKEGESKMVAFCFYLEKRHEDGSKKVGVGLSASVDLLRLPHEDEGVRRQRKSKEERAQATN